MKLKLVFWCLFWCVPANSMTQAIVFTNDYYTVFGDYTYIYRDPEINFPDIDMIKATQCELYGYFYECEKLIKQWNENSMKCWAEINQFYRREGFRFCGVRYIKPEIDIEYFTLN